MEIAEEKSEQGARSPADPTFYLRVFWRRKWVILGVVTAVMAGTVFYLLRQPKIYLASTSLIIDASAPKVLDHQVADVMESGTGNYWFNKEYYETQYKVITSRAVSERVVEKLGLRNDLAFLGVAHLTDEKVRLAALAKLDPVALLRSKIKLTPQKDSRIVYINVEDVDANRAALLSNEVAEAYIAENLSLRLRMTESASEWLEERLTTLDQQSRATDLSLYEFKKQADMLTTSLEDRQSMVSQKLNSTNHALSEVQTKIAGLRARTDALNALKKEGSNENGGHWLEGATATIESPLIQQLKVRYVSQRTECAELKDRYLSEHPKMVACEDKLRGARQDLDRELENMARAAETDLAEATAKERNLVALLERAKAEAFEVNRKQIEYDLIKREADNNRRLYDLVLKRLKDIELSGLIRTSNVRVLDAARPVWVPIKPNLRASLVIALLVALLLGGGVSLVLEFLDNTISSQAEVEEHLGLPFLGFVPQLPGDKTTDSVSRDLFVHRNPKSTIAESCRAIRTNLLFMSPESPFRRMLVTSCAPQEGKSTSVINVGITMAQSGNRVLLLDTDMRKPRLHKAFGVPNDIGISSVVVGEGRLEDAIKATEVPGLFVLPCGPIPPNPAELLHTKAFNDLLTQVDAKFDRVILDSPPVGPVADAAVLATLVDGVVVVLKAGKTTREMARRSMRSLNDVNAKLYGVVLNAINLDDPKYGDYYYSYRRYGNYYGEKKDEAAKT